MILQEGLESIGDYCFCDTRIREIVIPRTVKSIGDNAFYECKNLIDVTLPEGLESIGVGCFRYTAIKEIIIPKSVKSIGKYAFSGYR